jgi:hypothetical protein
MNYPVRDNHFAHKTFRLMHKASVAAEIGRDAFCLVAVVLHTEDAARYRGPVSFYNSQLMETLGFSKWDTFDKARQKAIDAGWLAYTGFGNRKPGLYHVTIPSQYTVVEDGLMEELYPENGYNQGYNQGYKDGYNQGVTEGITRGQLGVQLGGTSYPIPNPNPNPISCSESKTTLEPKIEIEDEVKPGECRFPIFPCSGKPKTWQASQQAISDWALAFPSVDIEQEMRRAHVWVMANLTKRKTAKGMPKFLTTWLGKAQDKPKSHVASSEPFKQKVMELPRLVIDASGRPA